MKPETVERRMNALRGLQRFLDEAFGVPGTSLRFGWDPLIGLLPWAGDALTAVVSVAIVVQAHRMRVPRVVQLRMLINIVIDLLAGAVPLVGDLIDFAWKSNTKNMALLERHASDELAGAARGDWLFVGGVVAVVIVVALVPLFVMYWLLNALAAYLPALAR